MTVENKGFGIREGKPVICDCLVRRASDCHGPWWWWWQLGYHMADSTEEHEDLGTSSRWMSSAVTSHRQLS
jgi:hypothetical protein